MKYRKSSPVLLSIALAVAAAPLLVPHSAQAQTALFRVERAFFGAFTPFYFPQPTPPSQPPTCVPGATATCLPGNAYVGPTQPAQKFTLPPSFISYVGAYYCVPGQCFPGYPVSGAYYSYRNGQARFRPNNPYGPTTTTTAVFPTTRGNNLPFDNTLNAATPGLPNFGEGAPVTPTTTFGGRYDFSRAGSIQVTPGPNKFSGTMRFIAGPNAKFYQLITYTYPFTSRAYGTFLYRLNGMTITKYGTPTYTTRFGEITDSGMVTRYRLTEALIYRECLGATGTPCCNAGPAYMTDTCDNTFHAATPPPQGALNGGPANWFSKKAYYLHVAVPWTTGMIRGYQPLGTYLTHKTDTGYDDRTHYGELAKGTAGGFYGVLSLVRPRLIHTYLRSADPGVEIETNFQAVRLWTMKVNFLPEPGEMLLLGAGIAALVGLARLRRR